MNKLWILLLCLLAGCAKKEQSRPGVLVEVAEVTTKDMQKYVYAIGNIDSQLTVEVRPQVDGIIVNSYVEDGAFVEAGDLLIEIDPRPYQHALDESVATLWKDQAALELAQETVARYTDVAARDFISPLTFDQYVANAAIAAKQVAADEAAVAINQINLERCTITAPISGRAGVNLINEGNLVVNDNTQAIIEIRTLSPVDVWFYIPQKELLEVQQAASFRTLPLEVTVEDQTRSFLGHLYFIDNHVDMQSGMVFLKGSVANDDFSLWPGAFAEVRLFTKMLKDASVIPFAALQIGQKGQFVYVVQEDMTVKATYVEVGVREEDMIAITSGLKLGEKVVVNGQLNLRNGALVTIRDKQ